MQKSLCERPRQFSCIQILQHLMKIFPWVELRSTDWLQWSCGWVMAEGFLNAQTLIRSTISFFSFTVFNSLQISTFSSIWICLLLVFQYAKRYFAYNFRYFYLVLKLRKILLFMAMFIFEWSRDYSVKRTINLPLGSSFS